MINPATNTSLREKAASRIAHLMPRIDATDLMRLSRRVGAANGRKQLLMDLIDDRIISLLGNRVTPHEAKSSPDCLFENPNTGEKSFDKKAYKQVLETLRENNELIEGDELRNVEIFVLISTLLREEWTFS